MNHTHLHRMRIPLVGVLAVLVLFSVAIVGCGKKPGAANKAKKPSASDAIPVGTQTVSRGSIGRKIDVTGQLAAERMSPVASKMSARVTAVLVSDGQHVSAGQTLVTLDQSDVLPAVDQAEAGLRVAQAAHDQALASQDVTRTKVQTDLQQAKDAQTQAQARLDILRKGARPEERRQAEEAVNAAKAGYDKANADFERAKNLAAQGAISKQALDGAQAQYEAAQAQYRGAQQALQLVEAGVREEEITSAEAALSQTQQAVRLVDDSRQAQLRLASEQVRSAQAGIANATAQVTRAKQALGDTIITAPISGTVGSKAVDLGQVVAPGVLLMSIYNSGLFSFDAQVSEIDITQIAIGQSVDVTLDALPGETLNATVSAILPLASEASRSFKVKITLRDTVGRLRAGMSARGEVLLHEQSDTILVPTAAVLGDVGDQYVYVIENGKAARRIVVTGIANRDEIEVIKGLVGGEQLIISGQSMVEDGHAVRVTKG